MTFKKTKLLPENSFVLRWNSSIWNESFIFVKNFIYELQESLNNDPPERSVGSRLNVIGKPGMFFRFFWFKNKDVFCSNNTKTGPDM